jgi:hypothetical protein
MPNPGKRFRRVYVNIDIILVVTEINLGRTSQTSNSPSSKQRMEIVRYVSFLRSFVGLSM